MILLTLLFASVLAAILTLLNHVTHLFKLVSSHNPTTRKAHTAQSVYSSTLQERGPARTDIYSTEG